MFNKKIKILILIFVIITLNITGCNSSMNNDDMADIDQPIVEEYNILVTILDEDTEESIQDLDVKLNNYENETVIANQNEENIYIIESIELENDKDVKIHVYKDGYNIESLSINLEKEDNEIFTTIKVNIDESEDEDKEDEDKEDGDKEDESEKEIAEFRILDIDIQIGMSRSEIVSLLGEPDRIDPTPYGYEWYIYNSDLENYLQIGIKNSKVVKVYSNSVKSSFQDVNIGMPISDAKEKLSLEDEIVFDYENATITMWPKGSTKDWLYMNFYPRVGKNSEDIIAYYIFDVHDDNKITSIIVGDTESILASGNYGYQISWTGERPDFELDEISSEHQELVDEAIGYQFQDLINSIRVRNGIHTLDWNEDASVISVQHSMDMYYNDFFDHESPTTGRPADRAQAQGINYSRIAENISYGRNGSILTHEGLMNSFGHRNNILNEKVTEFGAGSYQSHKYTQIFLDLR